MLLIKGELPFRIRSEIEVAVEVECAQLLVYFTAGRFSCHYIRVIWRRWMDKWIDACCLWSGKHRPGYWGLRLVCNHSLVETKPVRLPFRGGLAVTLEFLECWNSTLGNHQCAICSRSPVCMGRLRVLFATLNRLLHTAATCTVWAWMLRKMQNGGRRKYWGRNNLW